MEIIHVTRWQLYMFTFVYARDTCLIQFEYYTRQIDQGHRTGVLHIFILIILISRIYLHRIYWCMNFMMCRVHYTPKQKMLDKSGSGARFLFFFLCLWKDIKIRSNRQWKKKILKKNGACHIVIHLYVKSRATEEPKSTHIFHLQIHFNLIYVRACVSLVYCCLNTTIAIKNNYAMLHAFRNI